jgi:hypothetical protein
MLLIIMIEHFVEKYGNFSRARPVEKELNFYVKLTHIIKPNSVPQLRTLFIHFQKTTNKKVSMTEKASKHVHTTEETAEM